MRILKYLIIILISYIFNVSAHTAAEDDSPIGTPLPQAESTTTQKQSNNQKNSEEQQTKSIQEPVSNTSKEKLPEVPAEAQTNVTVPYTTEKTEQKSNDKTPKAVTNDNQNK